MTHRALRPAVSRQGLPGVEDRVLERHLRRLEQTGLALDGKEPSRDLPEDPDHAPEHAARRRFESACMPCSPAAAGPCPSHGRSASRSPRRRSGRRRSLRRRHARSGARRRSRPRGSRRPSSSRPDPQDVVAVLSADHVGHLEVLLDVLLGQDRLAGGDLPHERQPVGRTASSPCGPSPRSRAAWSDRAAAARSSRAWRGARAPSRRSAGRRPCRSRAPSADSRLLRVPADVVEDLLLALGQVHRSISLPRSAARGGGRFIGEHMFGE